MSKDLIRKINDAIGSVNYIPYNITDTSITLGIPQIPITGFQYVWANFDAPQKVMVKSLNGKAIWVSNSNKTGTIEFALLPGTLSNGQIEIMTLTGIPFPISIVDKSTGGTSRVLGVSCQLVSTPEWRRDLMPGLNVYTFATNRLEIFHGIRGINQ